MATVTCQFCEKTTKSGGAMRFHLAKCKKAPEDVRKANTPRLKGIPHPNMRKTPARPDPQKQPEAGPSGDRPAAPAPSASGDERGNASQGSDAGYSPKVAVSHPGELPPPLPPDPAPKDDEKAEALRFTEELKDNLRIRGPRKSEEEQVINPEPDNALTNDNLHEEARSRLKPWLWILGGMALIGGVAALILSRKRPEPKKPKDPPKPAAEPESAVDPWDR